MAEFARYADDGEAEIIRAGAAFFVKQVFFVKQTEWRATLADRMQVLVGVEIRVRMVEITPS